MSVKQNIYFLCLHGKCLYVFIIFEGVCPGNPTCVCLAVCGFVVDLFSFLSPLGLPIFPPFLPLFAPNLNREPKQNIKKRRIHPYVALNCVSNGNFLSFTPMNKLLAAEWLPSVGKPKNSYVTNAL